MNKHIFSQLINKVGSFFSLFVGKIIWSSPPWIKHLRQVLSSHRRLVVSIIAALVGVSLLGVYSYYWHKNQPHPALISAIITPPQMTPVDKVLTPDRLIIDFGITTDPFTEKSVAPLNSIDKTITDGVTLTPSIPGKWVWESDSRLVFTPSQDWPAGQDYTVQFKKSFFAPTAKMADLSYSFSTLPFEANIAEFKFYQDPINPQLRLAVATLNFNFPVDTKSLESNTSLTLETLKNAKVKQHFKFNFSYDENKRIAYLRSEPLPLPDTSKYLKLAIKDGVKSSTGSSATLETLEQTTLIPDANSYFKISNSKVSIVKNNQGRPEQILTIESTVGATESEMNKAIHVYLLPQDYPASDSEAVKENYQWNNPGEVTGKILKLATPITLQTIPGDQNFASLHSYKINVAPTRYVYIKLEKGIHSFGDYLLADNYTSVVPIPDYPKEIDFLHKGALLALNSEKKLSVLVRGVPAVKFQIARVLPENVNQLITQTEGNFNNPRFINPSFNQDNISKIYAEIQTFNDDPAKEQYTAIDLGKYLATKTNPTGPQGLFLLQAIAWDKEKNVPLEVKTSQLVLVTDLGLMVKDNSDGSHDLFIQSITKGTPIAKAKVAILGKNGLPILSRISDEQGHASFPAVKDFTQDREPIAYLVQQGNDISFIPFNSNDRQLNFSKFDIGGVYNDVELQTLSAYLFSDRKIYRPGDTAHFGGIVKQAYAQQQPAGLPLEITVTDSKGATVKDQKFTLDASGYFTFDLAMEYTSPTGEYAVNVFIIKNNHQGGILGSTTIRVAEFQPDRMRINSQLSVENTKGWISPNNLIAKINLWNLYGAPATQRKITGKITLTPQHISFPEFPQYTFIDPLLDPNKPPKIFTDTLTDTTTNAEGLATFALNLERFDKASYQLTFSAEGFEAEGGRSVATETSALISPLDYFIGYKPDGNLSYIKQHDQRKVNLIAVNPQLKLIAVNNLKIQIAELQTVSTLVKNNDGTFQYKSLVKNNILSTTPLSISQTNSDYVLPTQQTGDFIVTILDQNNTELSRFKFTVAGTSQLSLSKNAELAIKLNKTEYVPGEEIELQITAPYTGGGLITIERDKVYATQWFKTNTMSSVQKIRVPKDFKGNGYINVAFVRNWDSPEIFVSPLSYSIAPFSINHSNQAIKINLTTPDLAQPGEPFIIKYKSDKPGKIIIFAVDEGILQVADYKTPDPLAYFFQKHALEVITQQTVDQILPKYIQARELSAVGGDGSADALRSHINPFKRKTDLPVVYWSGIVDTDTVERQLVYPLPDYFNGTLRVMAVAVAPDAVGAAEKKSIVKGDFVINPNVPTFVAPGDEFQVTASIANNVKGSGNNANITVEISATPQLEIISNTKQTINISENQEKSVSYKIRAKDFLDTARIDFIASLGNKSRRMSSTLSVRPANNFSTTLVSGTSQDAEKKFALTRIVYPEYRKVTAVASSSPLVLLLGLQRYLDNFPYGCTEQLVSKAFPLMALINNPELIDDKIIATHKINETIQLIAQRQMSSGGFSYWPEVGDYPSNEFASVYAMHFLTEAKAHNYPVPNDVFLAGISYLKELAQHDVTDLNQARIQAYAIYILTRNEIVTTNYLTHLQVYLDQDKKQTWHQDIIGAYLAATYQLLKNENIAKQLIEYYQPHAQLKEPSDFYTTDNADAQYLYLLALHFPDLLTKKGELIALSLVDAMNNGAINTIFSSYASLALSAYGDLAKKRNDNPLSISEIFTNNETKTPTTLANHYLKINLNVLTKKISIHNPSKQTYFYQILESGFDKQLPTSAVKNNMEVYREYHDLQGNIIDHATLGDEIEVHIQVRSLKDEDLNNIAIVDLLPGGFEVVNDSVMNNNVDSAEAREDRVVFFSSVTPSTKEIVYRIKAINQGKYTVPAVFAESMYNPLINAHSAVSSIGVKE